MSKEQQENHPDAPEKEPGSAAERFRSHLRTRLTEMRENARRIGASSAYIDSLDRSANVVLMVIAAAKTNRPAETTPADA